MKNLIISLIIYVFFTSCDKIGQRNIVVKGSALSGSDNSPIAGHTVLLKELKSTLPGVDVTVVQSIETNSNGEFEFEFEAKKASKFKYEVELMYNLDDYFSCQNTVTRQTIDKSVDQTVILSICEASNIVFTTQNINPFDDNDEIIIKLTSNNYNNQNFYYYKGYTSDEYSRKSDAPAGPYDCKIIVIKNQIETVKDTAFTAPKFGTVYFNYSY